MPSYFVDWKLHNAQQKVYKCLIAINTIVYLLNVYFPHFIKLNDMLTCMGGFEMILYLSSYVFLFRVLVCVSLRFENTILKRIQMQTMNATLFIVLFMAPSIMFVC